jgi:hypothetical protein
MEKKTKMKNKIEGIQGSFSHVIQINKPSNLRETYVAFGRRRETVITVTRHLWWRLVCKHS